MEFCGLGKGKSPQHTLHYMAYHRRIHISPLYTHTHTQEWHLLYATQECRLLQLHTPHTHTLKGLSGNGPKSHFQGKLDKAYQKIKEAQLPLGRHYQTKHNTISSQPHTTVGVYCLSTQYTPRHSLVSHKLHVYNSLRNKPKLHISGSKTIYHVIPL